MDTYANPEAALSALRDIEGVLGSFLVDPDGQVLARDLPPLFDGDALANASVHLSRLRAALEIDGNNFESCVARFGAHLLLLRAAQANTLCVLCPRGTNMPAVHMSTTLIARRLNTTTGSRSSSNPGPARVSTIPTLGARISHPPTMGTRTSHPGAPPQVAAAPETSSERRFRGRPV